MSLGSCDKTCGPHLGSFTTAHHRLIHSFFSLQSALSFLSLSDSPVVQLSSDARFVQNGESSRSEEGRKPNVRWEPQKIKKTSLLSFLAYLRRQSFYFVCFLFIHFFLPFCYLCDGFEDNGLSLFGLSCSLSALIPLLVWRQWLILEIRVFWRGAEKRRPGARARACLVRWAVAADLRRRGSGNAWLVVGFTGLSWMARLVIGTLVNSAFLCELCCRVWCALPCCLVRLSTNATLLT